MGPVTNFTWRYPSYTLISTMPMLFVKRCLESLVKEYERKPPEYWEAVSFPLNFERIFEGKVVQVEIEDVERTPEYDLISICVSAGWRSLFYPFGRIIRVSKKQERLQNCDKTGASL